jgi:5-formyltetrahydrofolate cyclo-ligase
MQRHFRETSFICPYLMNSSVTQNLDRAELRRHFRRLRRKLSVQKRQTHAAAVTRHLSNANLLLRSGAVAAYLTNHRDGELDCMPTIRRLWRMQREVVLPVVGRTRGFMDLYHYRPGTRLVTNRYGIAEPESDRDPVKLLSVSIVLLPLVAFDDGGGRLGMGGGYYDRFLGTVPAQLRPRLIGLAHDVQYSPSPLPADDWDIALDDIVTESGWRRCKDNHH